jgi:group I intron endonuclease
MGLIYMRISPSGGKYIGQTTTSEENRWKQHCKEAYHNTKDYNTILNRAIRKYGKDNFKCIILEQNIPEELLDSREQYWIAYYNSYYLNNEFGYNMTLGGGSYRQTTSNSIPVLQYDLNGNFIKRWSSAAEAAKSFNDIISNLIIVLNHGRLYSYKNYLWKYENDPITIDKLITQYKQSQANRSYKSQGVYCIENQTYYPSFSQAEKALNISRKMISKYAKLKQEEPKSHLHFILSEENK